MNKCQRCGKDTDVGSLIEGIDWCCPACIKTYEEKRMIETGRMVLWVKHTEYGVLVLHNWFSTLVFPVTKYTTCKHNIGRVQNSYYFYASDGTKWVGKHIGFNTYCRCKRLKHQYQNIEK